MEGRNQFAFAAWIPLGERSRIEERMRNIAASAAGDANLGEELCGALEERNVALSIRLRASDRGKESGSTAAGDYDLFTSHGGLCRKTADRSYGALSPCFRYHAPTERGGYSTQRCGRRDRPTAVTY